MQDDQMDFHRHHHIGIILDAIPTRNLHSFDEDDDFGHFYG